MLGRIITWHCGGCEGEIDNENAECWACNREEELDLLRNKVSELQGELDDIYGIIEYGDLWDTIENLEAVREEETDEN